MSNKFKIKLILLIFTAILVLAVLFQLWQRKRIVLTKKMPKTDVILEFREKPEVRLFSRNQKGWILSAEKVIR